MRSQSWQGSKLRLLTLKILIIIYRIYKIEIIVSRGFESFEKNTDFDHITCGKYFLSIFTHAEYGYKEKYEESMNFL